MTTLWTGVPKASVHEYREFHFGEVKIRISFDFVRMHDPTVDAGANDRHPQSEFRRSIATAADSSHGVRPSWRNANELALRQRVLEDFEHRAAPFVDLLLQLRL
jgi:hypothetical protein